MNGRLQDPEGGGGMLKDAPVPPANGGLYKIVGTVLRDAVERQVAGAPGLLYELLRLGSKAQQFYFRLKYFHGKASNDVIKYYRILRLETGHCFHFSAPS
jgi:hypothetical protein